MTEERWRVILEQLSGEPEPFLQSIQNPLFSKSIGFIPKIEAFTYTVTQNVLSSKFAPVVFRDKNLCLNKVLHFRVDTQSLKRVDVKEWEVDTGTSIYEKNPFKLINLKKTRFTLDFTHL